jgi:hypothetical protein
MNADANVNNRRRAGWLSRIARSLRMASGLVAAVGAAHAGAAAQESGYRPAAAAPAAWQAFAQRVRSHLEMRLAGEDTDAREFRDYVARLGTGSNRPFVASIWILSDGNIERLEFDELDDKEIAVQLRTLLIHGNVGAPPQDMLQPLRLRLSVRPSEPPAGDK